MFKMDAVKVDLDVAYVAIVIYVCCKSLLPMFHLYFSGGVGVSRSPTSKFLDCAYGSDGVLRGHKIYTGSGRTSLRPVHCCCSCY